MECLIKTLNPQESFCCKLQSRSIIENARLKLLTVWQLRLRGFFSY